MQLLEFKEIAQGWYISDSNHIVARICVCPMSGLLFTKRAWIWRKGGVARKYSAKQ